MTENATNNSNAAENTAAQGTEATGQEANPQGAAAEESKETDLGGGAAEASKEGDKQKEDNKEKTKDKSKEAEGNEQNELFGKPETYDYKEVKLPENMQLDEAMTGKFSEYATKLNLSQKGANDLIAMAVELTEQTQKQTVEAMGKLTEAKIEGFKQLLNADSEVGGAKLKESVATANLAYDGFFQDEELRNLLAEGGLNVHPKFIKALKAIGSQMKNDTIHSSTNPATDKKSREDVLFPSMDENK